MYSPLGSPRLSRAAKQKTIKIYTWNMQGVGKDPSNAQKIRNWMGEDGVVAICLQECGDIFGWHQHIANIPQGWQIAIYEEWGTDNNRCSLAILTRGSPTKTEKIDPIADTRRPIIGVQLGPFRIWNMHAPRNNVNYVSTVVQAVKTHSTDYSWILAGDFNLDPNGITVDRTQKATPPNPTHQNGGKLDYAFLSEDWSVEAKNVSINLADHFPVKFIMNK